MFWNGRQTSVIDVMLNLLLLSFTALTLLVAREDRQRLIKNLTPSITKHLSEDLRGPGTLPEVSLSPSFNGHFPGGPGLAGTRMYPFWILLELRVMKVVVKT